MRKPNWALLLISLSVLLASSVWFSGTAASAILKSARNLSEVQSSWLTISVQLGFIAGTFLFALLNVADIFRPRNVFFISALCAAAFNAGYAVISGGIVGACFFRFLTGVTLAGIYPVGMKLVIQSYRDHLGWRLGIMVGALTFGTAVPYLMFAAGADFNWRRLMLLASAAAVAGGLIVKFGLADGPYLQDSPPFDVRAGFRLFRNRDFKLQALGYFGHMWELYAFWSLSASYLASAFGRRPSGPPVSIAFLAFLTIGVGVLGCVLGGWLSKSVGERNVALVSLASSSVFCLCSGILYYAPAVVLVPAVLVWGIFVISDSPQFSALAARTAPPAYLGTALTLQNGIGFGITVVSIQIIAWAAPRIGWPWAFTALGIGPVAGAIAMLQLRPDRPHERADREEDIRPEV